MSSTVLINTDASTFENAKSLVAGNITEDTDPTAVLKPRGVIDVVNNFSWYAGPKATSKGLSEVPRMFLVEREQMLSSLIQGAMYYTKNAGEGVGDLAEAVFGSEAITSGIETLAGTAGKVLEQISGFVDTGSKEAAQADALLLATNNLKSLEGIYLTKPTGFKYTFPKYTFQGMEGDGGSWGTDSNTPIIGEIVDAGMEMVDNISKIANFKSPGVYIEKPKYFQTADKGETQSVEFPLINTIQRGTVSPIQQNYELLWLLAFQNRPYKTSFSRTPPPKIYSVTCPGQFSMPYAYLSSMTVDFQGTVRNSKVYIPTGSGGGISDTQVEVPVPEAYMVKLSFTSLIAKYGNTMISDAQNVAIGPTAAVVGNMPSYSALKGWDFK
jgi:hypothetical protein